MNTNEHNSLPLTSNEAIGLRIHDARKSLHMTQEELAQRIGISIGYVSCLERGRRPLTHHVLPHILSNLHLSYEYLIYGTSSRHALPSRTAQAPSPYDTYFRLEKLLDKCTQEEYEMCYQLCRAYLRTSRQALSTPKSVHPSR